MSINKKEVIDITYMSKRNTKLEKEVILSMITRQERWHYLAIKNCQNY